MQRHSSGVSPTRGRTRPLASIFSILLLFVYYLPGRTGAVLYHIEQDPGLLAVLPQSLHQQAMIEIVEQTSDVELNDPVIVPASAPGNSNRRQARLSRPIAVGIIAEDRIKSWLKPHLHRRLRDSVSYRWDAQYPNAT
jgi:hypothetical protein